MPSPRLPRVGIPLKAGEPDVVLDLRAALSRTYEAGAYAIRIDYAGNPIPPLGDADAGWTRKLLDQTGRASTSP